MNTYFIQINKLLSSISQINEKLSNIGKILILFLKNNNIDNSRLFIKWNSTPA